LPAWTVQWIFFGARNSFTKTFSDSSKSKGKKILRSKSGKKLTLWLGYFVFYFFFNILDLKFHLLHSFKRILKGRTSFIRSLANGA
jgi:hypothetical protein